MVFNKKGANNNLLVIGGIVLVALFLMNGGFGTQSTGTGSGSSGSAGSVFDGTTVTYSSWDMHSKGTDASSGHKILNIDGQTFLDVADDGTREATAGDQYEVLLGNTTAGLSAGDYYPLYVTGEVPNSATYTISGGQARVSGSSQITATFTNEDGSPNTDQAMGANDEVSVELRYKVANNYCAGNPNTGGSVDNALCFQYNDTHIQSVDLNSERAVSVPKSITAVAGKSIQCFSMPVICDNEDYENDLIIESTDTEPVTGNAVADISVYFVDGTLDYDAETLDIIRGYEDEDLNDIGIADFLVDTITTS